MLSGIYLIFCRRMVNLHLYNISAILQCNLQYCNIATILLQSFVLYKKNNICYDQVSMYSVLKRYYTTLVNILFHISKNSGDILSGQSYCPTLYVIYIRTIRRDSRFFNSSDSNHRDSNSNRIDFYLIQFNRDSPCESLNR